jgi:uncharacterized protein (TIGR02594 family)
LIDKLVFIFDTLKLDIFWETLMPKATNQIEWQWFIVGCLALVSALASFFWAFSFEKLSPSRRFLLLWMLPLASGFACGCFAGSIKATTKGTLAVVATGGFAVWLITFFLLQRIPTEPVENSQVISLLKELRTTVNDLKQQKSKETVESPSSGDIAAQESAVSTLSLSPQDSSYVPSATAPKWLLSALGELGQGEIAGTQSNPRILAYLKSVNLSPSLIQTDETPWSAAFINWAFSQAGIGTPKSAVNSAFLTQQWGVRLSQPIEGCLVVTKRTNNRYDLGFYLKDLGNSVLVISGNSYNKVRISAVPKNDVAAFIYPPNS